MCRARHARAIPVALVVASALLVGCDRAEVLLTGSVAGTVTFRGNPVREGRIMFRDDTQGNGSSTGIRDGRFVLHTPDGGLMTGRYRVLIRPEYDGSPYGGVPKFKAADDIPERYRTFETSGLEVVVAPGDNPPLAFDLTE